MNLLSKTDVVSLSYQEVNWTGSDRLRHELYGNNERLGLEHTSQVGAVRFIELNGENGTAEVICFR